MYGATGCDGIQQPSTRPLQLCRSAHHNPIFNRTDEYTAVSAAFACLRGDASRPSKSYGKKEASMVRIRGNNITARECLDSVSATPRTGQESTKIRSQNLWGIRRHHPEACPRLPLRTKRCGVGEQSHLLTHMPPRATLHTHLVCTCVLEKRNMRIPPLLSTRNKLQQSLAPVFALIDAHSLASAQRVQSLSRLLHQIKYTSSPKYKF